MSASGGSVKEMTKGIQTEFEKSMDDDLNAGEAFEAVYEILRRIESMKHTMSGSDADMLKKILLKIDSVFGVIL